MSVPRSAVRVERPFSLIPAGTAAGAVLGLSGGVLYGLLWSGWRAAKAVLTHTEGSHFVGLLVVGSLVGLGPTLLLGTFSGALVSAALLRTWRHQGPVRAWLTGTLVTYMVALLVNVVVLSRKTKVPLPYDTWVHRVGIPSVVFVLVGGGLGLWLYWQQRRALQADLDRAVLTD